MSNTSATGGYLTPIDEPGGLRQQYDTGLTYDSGLKNDSGLCFGLIQPSPEDAEFDRQIQVLITGLTGLTGPAIRPRWQVVPANRPNLATDWVSFGIVDSQPDDNPYISHQSSNTYDSGLRYDIGTRYDAPVVESDVVQRHEELQVLVSFYGPQAGRFARYVREGLYLSQNREGLTDLSLISVGNITSVPELVNEQWARKLDLMLQFRRRVASAYSILNIQSAPVNLGPGKVVFNVEE